MDHLRHVCLQLCVQDPTEAGLAQAFDGAALRATWEQENIMYGAGSARGHISRRLPRDKFCLSALRRALDSGLMLGCDELAPPKPP